MTLTLKSKPEVAAHEPAVKGGIGSSMTVWIVIVAVVVGVVWNTVAYYRATHVWSYEEKLVRFFDSNSHPDLILIGSSVALSSSYESDRAIGLAKGQAKVSYMGAEQLAGALQSQTGKTLTTTNLACYAALCDYAYMLCSKFVEFHRVPKVLMYEMVSRDLFDASMPRYFESPYYTAMSKLHPRDKGLPAQLWDGLCDNAIISLLRSPFEMEGGSWDRQRMRFEADSVLSALLYPYQRRVEISTAVTNAVGRCINRAPEADQTVKQQIANKMKNPFAQLSTQPAAPVAVDDTPQVQRFEEERRFFFRLLELCRRQGIKLIVVNMPVTDHYQQLVPVPLRSRWTDEILAHVTDEGFDVIDVSAMNRFSDDDFIDAAHLNGKGSLKLNDILSKEIARRGILQGIAGEENKK